VRLKERISIVTGGGSGIGRATALRFANEGASVLVADIDGSGARHTVASIEAGGGHAASVAADVSDEAAASRIVHRAMELWGRVDVLVNNAASFHHRRVEEATRVDWDMVLGVNVMGTSFCSKHAVEVMKTHGGGAIVNVASINGLVAMPAWVTYNASKAAVIEMSKSMAMDLAPFNIRVNCVCPGMTDTPALKRVIDEFGISTDQAIEAYVAPRCLIKRFGKPEEVAAVIAFLASDDASYMTGSTVVVDGGFTA
jgi:NAD(P)-dependent dehydrogenase (short-subunit alcohol dehydrogenase family)